MRLDREDELTLIFMMADDGVTEAGFEMLNAAHQRVEQLGGAFEANANSEGNAELTIRFPLKPPVELTAREMEVIQLLVEGLTNKEIAARLTVSARTVNFHLDNIYSKLGVNTRTEAAIYALRQGWIERPV
jgi:DNA-binding NarL/FixJ family response regulator